MNAADASVENLFDEVKGICESIQDESTGFLFRCEEKRFKGRSQIGVYTNGLCMIMTWHRAYANILDGSVIDVGIYKGYVRVNSNLWAREEPVRLMHFKCSFDLSATGEGWRMGSPNGDFLTIPEIADFLVSKLVDRIRNVRLNK